MRRLVIICSFLTTWGAFAEPPYGDDHARAVCIQALAQSEYFQKNPVRVTDNIVINKWFYTLSVQGIHEERMGLIWSFDSFARNGDVAGRIHLQTIHAQILLIAKAFENLEAAKLTPQESAEILRALGVCAKMTDVLGPRHPDDKGSLYSGDKRDLGDAAAGIARALSTGQ